MFSHLLQLLFCSMNVYNSTTVCSRARDHFVNSVFPNKKTFAQKSNFIYDKQKMIIANVTGKWPLTLSNQATMSPLQHFKQRTMQETFCLFLMLKFSIYIYIFFHAKGFRKLNRCNSEREGIYGPIRSSSHTTAKANKFEWISTITDEKKWWNN